MRFFFWGEPVVRNDVLAPMTRDMSAAQHGETSRSSSQWPFETVRELHLAPGLPRLSSFLRKLIVLSGLACAALAQAPRISDINYYGLHKITAQKIQAVTGLAKGGNLSSSKGDLEDEIAKIPGVVLVRVEAVCCAGSSVELFIGIEERGAAHPSFHSPPEGNATLPPELMSTYAAFLTAVAHAAARGNTAEDLTPGYAMMDDPEARAFQSRFLTFAADHFDWLRDVVRNASDQSQRAVAAAVIGYAANKQQAVGELQYAIGDPDGAVRVNAMHALTAIAVYAARHPDQGIRIAPTWLVEMLHSIVLEDRLQAARALVVLTDSPNAQALDLIRERALDSLSEMARWTALRYALPPFLLLGRVAGLPDREVHAQWENGGRESVIEKALALEPGRRSRQ